jgi:hypothetical protein
MYANEQHSTGFQQHALSDWLASPCVMLMMLHPHRALELAGEVAKSAPLALRMAKAAVNHGIEVRGQGVLVHLNL